MGAHSGPDIVTDGLVFSYDMDNTAKSFKGKPTINLFDNPVFATGTRAPWNYQTTANGDDSIDTSFTYEGFNTAKIVRTSTGGESNYWVNSSSVVSGDINPNTEYTFSAYAYATVANQAALFSYFGTQSSGFAYHPGGGKWVRLSHTFTSRSTSPYVQLRMWSDTTTLNTPVYFTKLQLEEGSFATPFVNGTRSNTQALLDISKSKNTVTPTSLTYNSDGTFQFNNNNYLSLNTGITGSNFTVLMWHYNGASSFATAGHRTFLSTNNLRFQWDDTPDRGPFVDFNSGSGGGQANFGSSLTPANFLQKYTMVGLVGGSTVKTTFNDVASGQSSTISGTRKFSSNGNVSIGIDNLSGIGGSDHINREGSVVKMPLIQIYNRALTAAEIKQNFNATRGRFGI